MRSILLTLLFSLTLPLSAADRKTTIDIRGQSFLINNQLTYPNRTFKGHKIEGLLINARLVQGIFDDLNPATRHLWKYPDGSPFDADRNTTEFIAAMPTWRLHGLLCFTINFQGGSPQGYSNQQPWINSAFSFDDGSLRPDYLARLEKILDAADEHGMAVILGFFYFGQEPRFKDEAAILKATDNATDWILSKGYTNILVEINNECNVRYKHAISKPARVHELIQRVQTRSQGKVKNAVNRLYVSTSYGGGTIPGENVAQHADFLLLHGNGVGDPNRIRDMVARTRALKAYKNQPILFNEDDHFDFDKEDNNFLAAVSQYASWGYFDFRMKNESFSDGYQSVPVNWQISSPRKKAFFTLLKEMTAP